MNVRVYGLVEGLMVSWDEVKEAARYHIHLYIGDWHRHTEIINGYRQVVNAKKQEIKEIALVDVDRNFKYYSFKGLAKIHFELSSSGSGVASVCRTETGRNYLIKVEAEDRNGEIIDSSEMINGTVSEH